MISRSLSPAGRILCSVILVASVATLNARTSSARIAVLGLVLTVALLARPEPLMLFRRWLVGLGAILGLCVPWVMAGNWSRALEVGGRASAATLIALAFAATLSLRELPGALRSLRLPAEFVSTVHTMLWQVGNIGREGKRLVLARRLRGARGAIGPEILAELLVRTTARAERVDLAMRLRGVHSETAARRASLSALDLVASGIAFATGVGLHLLGRAA